MTIAINGANHQDTVVQQQVCANRLRHLEDALLNSKSASHMRVHADSVFGVRALTEVESSAPQILDYSTHTVVVIGTDVVRAGGNSGQNNILVTDFMQNVGASANFNRAHNMLANENNLNLSPSNYFFVDMPEETGDYADLELKRFMEGHYREDWFLYFEAMNNQAGNAGVLTTALQENVADPTHPNVPATVAFNSNFVISFNDFFGDGCYKFKICGLATVGSARVSGEDPTFDNKKFVCFVNNRD